MSDIESQAKAIAAELRCVVCQNQTVADSQAELAVDLRRQIGKLLAGGASREQVLAYMTARYGDFVLYKPPLRADTAALWFGPGVLLVGGLGALAFVLRRREKLPAGRFEPDPEDVSESNRG